MVADVFPQSSHKLLQLLNLDELIVKGKKSDHLELTKYVQGPHVSISSAITSLLNLNTYILITSAREV